VKSKSRFGIISLVVVATLALLYALPALASDGSISKTTGDITVDVGVHDPHVDNTHTQMVIVNSSVAKNTVDAQDSKVGNTLYVSNSSSAFNRVLIQVTDATADDSGSADTVTAVVKNITTGVVITSGLALSETGAATNDFQATFDVVSTTASGAQIQASTGDLIEVTITEKTVGANSSKDSAVIQLTVDAQKPTIAATGPAHSTLQTSTTGVFSGTITDLASGLRSDAEGSDNDADGVTSAEPRAVAGGGSADIAININFSAASGTSGATEESAQATAGWQTVTGGYRFIFSRPNLAEGTTYWNVVATDRAGNIATTDADGSAATNNHYKLSIDLTDPGISKAEAGIGYNSTLNKEIASASSIKLTWKAGGLTGGAAESLDTTTLDIGDFRVEKSSSDTSSLVITGLIHPNLSTAGSTTSKLADGTTAFDSRNVTYITLEQALVANSKPQVVVIGNIRDLAGRAAPPEEQTSLDSIKPALTVTATGSTTGRPSAEGGSTGKITITVVSDEALNAAPTANLVRFALASTSSADVKVAGRSAVTMTAVAGAVNTWSGSASAATNFTAALVGVHVVATDKASPGNTGTTAGLTDDDVSGHTANVPDDAESVDLSKWVLFEFDTLLSLATSGDQFELTPSTTVGGAKTESANPFVRINLQESNEYPLANSTDSVDKFTFGTTTTTTVEVDTHDTVALTTLNLVNAAGTKTDLLGTQGSVDDDSFVVALSSLAVGNYTIEVDGTDNIGNKLGLKKYTFEVVARAAYSVALSPGFNLVSLPGDPVDPSLDAVLPSSHPATTVLSYQPAHKDGPWLVATRSAGVNWSANAANTLSEIRSGQGYWVQTGAFTPLKTSIPERDPSQVLPTFPVVAGWNLVGVVDLTLASTAATVSADSYLASINWTIAYTFDTQSNKWTKITKGSSPVGVFNNGQGLWTWSEKKDVLAP